MPRGRPTRNSTAPRSKPPKANGNGANLGFEAQMFLAADKLRKNLEPSDYKHVALGLIFLKHISNAFEAKRADLLAEASAVAEDPANIWPKMCSGCPKRRAGRIYKPTPSSRPSASSSTTRWPQL